MPSAKLLQDKELLGSALDSLRNKVQMKKAIHNKGLMNKGLLSQGSLRQDFDEMPYLTSQKTQANDFLTSDRKLLPALSNFGSADGNFLY